jgi:cytoskeletal protein CcmA (bactofilin family)
MMENKHGALMVGEGVTINGNIELKADIHIYGMVHGEIHAQDVFFGESGHVHGLIMAENIQIKGEVEHNLIARQTLIIKSSGRVKGDVAYDTLEIESGGSVEGKLEKHNPKKTIAQQKDIE